MNRLEKFRQIRQVKRKFLSIVFLCVFLLISGICIVDYSVNSLIRNNKNVGLIELKSSKSYIEVCLLNNKLYINTSYINRDIKRIRKLVSDVTH